MGALAPELVPMLASLSQPANFVPTTNAVLSEMGRRGVTKDKLLATLGEMAKELPAPSVEMLAWAGQAGLDVRVLSDCNSIFIRHMLQGTPHSQCLFLLFLQTTVFSPSFWGNKQCQQGFIHMTHLVVLQVLGWAIW